MIELDTSYFREHARTCRLLAMSIDGIMSPPMREALRVMANEYEITAAELAAAEYRNFGRDEAGRKTGA